MLYTLLVTRGPDEGLRYPIRSHTVTVGRAADMSLVLTDPEVQLRHFVVNFVEGGWTATTYERGAKILIDRRWEHPVSKQRGARIFVGGSQLLLVAGENIDLAVAQRAAQGLAIDEETLRDDALTTVRDEELEFSDDMKGKARRVHPRATSADESPTVEITRPRKKDG